MRQSSICCFWSVKNGVTTLLGLFFLFVSCTKAPFEPSNETLPLLQGVVQARSGSPADRVVLPSGTQLGIFAFQDASTKLPYATNLAYISDQGKLLPIAEPLQYPKGQSSALLYCYAPYNESGYMYQMMELQIESDQNARGAAYSDILWGTMVVDKSNATPELKMAHLMSLIKINLTSKAGKELGQAKVELPNQFYAIRIDPRDGVVQFNGYNKTSIRAQQMTSNSYQAIVMPQQIQDAEFIRVTVGAQSYVFNLSGTSIEAGKEYTFDLTVRDDVVVPAEFELKVTYKDNLVGTTLTVPAVGENESLVLDDGGVYGKLFKVRNESGAYSWAHINNTLSSGNKDEMSAADRYCKLQFDENFGPKRTMVLEFYDKAQPKATYKQITITQHAATNYLNLSGSSASADQLGTVYDMPYEVDIRSNQAWQIDNPTDWIKPQYQPGVLNQTMRVSVEANNTGAARTGVLRFMVDGTAVKTYTVTQSAVENSTFTLKYELNLVITTSNDWFVHQNNYPDIVEVFNYYPSEYGDETAKITSNARYGFVTDAPASYRRIEVKNFRHDKFFTVRNYTGRASSIGSMTIAVVGQQLRYPFLYPFRVSLPIPSGVKRNQKVILYVTIQNATQNMGSTTAVVRPEIVDQ